jgi:hypothetical protein
MAPMSMTVAVSAVIVFLIAYTTAGALLASNTWNFATWASTHDLWHRKPAVFRAGGFVMAVSGPALLGFVVVEILGSR